MLKSKRVLVTGKFDTNMNEKVPPVVQGYLNTPLTF